MKNNAPVEICQRIRDEMAAQKPPWRNMDLARVARLSPRLITNIRKGTASLRDRTIADIAAALGVRYEWLARGEEPRGLQNEPSRAMVLREKIKATEAAAKKNYEDLLGPLLPLPELIRQMAAQLGVPDAEMKATVAEIMMKEKKP